jgi:hypothetical protein
MEALGVNPYLEPQRHRLLSLPEVHGGGCAVVLRYVKRPPTKNIRQTRQTRRAKKRREKPRGAGSGKVKNFTGLFSNNVLKRFLL